MSREKIDYRENLRRLDEKIPGVELLDIKQAASVIGIDRRTVMKRYGSEFNNKMISKVKLARLLSQ